MQRPDQCARRVFVLICWGVGVLERVCFVEFVFLLGRCPSLPWIRAGQNSIMFYNITRRLLKILFNLFVLVVGFAFGFFILQKDTPHDHFENPIKSIVKVNSRSSFTT